MKKRINEAIIPIVIIILIVLLSINLASCTSSQTEEQMVKSWVTTIEIDGCEYLSMGAANPELIHKANCSNNHCK